MVYLQFEVTFMVAEIARWVLLFFGLFLVAVGLYMIFAPRKVRAVIGKAASTPMIHYGELTIRLIPAAALVLYGDQTSYAMIFKALGWFMIATSMVLYFVPRRLHHQYALWCTSILNPIYVRMLSPLSMAFGAAVIYAVV